MSGGWGNGSTRAWRKIRLFVLNRDGWTCRLAIPGVCAVKANCVHHTLGRAVTGDNPAFLVAACTPCNLKIGEPGRPRGRTRRVPRPAPRRTVYDRW